MDKEFVFGVSACVVGLALIFGSGLYSSYRDTEAIKSLSARGIDPMVARCAISPTERILSMCGALAVKK